MRYSPCVGASGSLRSSLSPPSSFILSPTVADAGGAFRSWRSMRNWPSDAEWPEAVAGQVSRGSLAGRGGGFPCGTARRRRGCLCVHAYVKSGEPAAAPPRVVWAGSASGDPQLMTWTASGRTLPRQPLALPQPTGWALW